MNTPTALQRLEVDFTVESIMTRHDQFVAAKADADLGNLVLPDDAEKYDLLPVVCDGHVVGVYYKSVGHKLTHDWLISQDTPIADLPELLAHPDRPGFLVLHGQGIVGIVTPADLNEVPARVFCYELLAHLELALEGWMRLAYKGDQRELVALLGKREREGECPPDSEEKGDRETEILEAYEEQKLKRVEIDYIELFNLADLFNVLCRHKELRTKLGLASGNQVSKATSGINELRKSIMHPVRPLVFQGSGLEGVTDLHHRIERAKSLIERIGEHGEPGA